MNRFHCVLICIVLLVPCGRAGAATNARLVSIGTVSPRHLALEISTGRIETFSQIPYEPREGDLIDDANYNGTPVLVRAGQRLGTLVGRDRKLLKPYDRYEPSNLDVATLDDPAVFQIAVNGAPPASPVRVFRKSKPTAKASGATDAFSQIHRLYLELPQPLRTGDTVRVTVSGEALPPMGYLHDSRVALSEAIHVNQIGYRPDDPFKSAFLSCWMGDGGGVTYEPAPVFHLLDAETGDPVFTATARLSRLAGEPEDDRKRNYTLADVWQMDFSGFSRPGRYRLHVEGIGCSQPFVIEAQAWHTAFRTALRGIYHQRSGLALGPPHTGFVRPRDMHPDDGVVVRATRASILETRNGGAAGTDNFKAILAGATTEPVAQAWGGYHDAADWDRQTSHLEIARALLELLEIFPAAAQIDLNIPESGNKIPDLLDEALWGIDFFARLQTSEGGVRGGIESAEHPRQGEGSWQESHQLYAYRPDAATSYQFCAAAIWAAHLLRPYDPARAQALVDRALRAFHWAEQRTPEAGLAPVRDARNFAALHLFRLTGQKRWHDVFLATCVVRDASVPLSVWGQHNQTDAAFLYARMPAEGLDATLLLRVVQALAQNAQSHAAQIAKSGLRWSKTNDTAPISWGRVTKPDMINVLRLHALTRDPRLIALAGAASQFGLGANPSNLVFTTGLGSNPVRNVMHCDANALNVPVPDGMFMMGLYDVSILRPGEFKWILDPLREVVFPAIDTWPVLEATWDIGAWPQMNEFVTPFIAQNAYVWGYLAFRPPLQVVGDN